MKNLSDGYLLSSGKLLPCVGYGTWRSPEGDVCVQGVRTALQAGYRHIDTASIYGNETSVGEGIRLSGVPREEIFLTSKLWNSDQGYARAQKAFELSLKKLKAEYLDLYLIHWPVAYEYRSTYPKEMLESWEVIVGLHQKGLIKSIGVSNFLPHHLDTLIQASGVVPMVNQIELHPGLQQSKAVAYCKQRGIVLEAWSPLCKGKCFDKPAVAAAAKAHGKTPAQILVRWSLQKGFVPLPKSVTPARIYENADVFDFSLTKEEMTAVSVSVRALRLGSHPDHTQF